MARTFSFLTVALATVAAALCGSSSAIAQPAPSTTGASSGSKAPESAEMEQADKYFKAGDLKNTMKSLHEAGLKNPKLPSEYILMYAIFMNRRQPNQARAFLERAVDETPSDPEPWVLLGDIALNEGRLAESRLDLLKANQLLDGYKSSHKPLIQNELLLNLASWDERKERWDDAQRQLEKYLVNVPEDVRALQRLARAKFWQKKVREAYSDLQ